MENLSLVQIKSKHDELMSQYLILVDYVRTCYQHAFLRILVENHIQKRLLELSTELLLISSNPTNCEDAQNWYRQTSVNNKNVADVMISLNALLAKPLKFLKGLGLFALSYIIFLIYGEPKPIMDVLVSPDSFIQPIITIYTNNQTLILGGVMLVVVIFFLIIGYRFLDASDDKYKLLSNQIRKKASVQPDNLKNIYSLENDLFYLLGKRKKIVVPVDLIISVITLITTGLLLSLVLIDLHPGLSLFIAIWICILTIVTVFRHKDRFSNLLV